MVYGETVREEMKIQGIVRENVKLGNVKRRNMKQGNVKQGNVKRGNEKRGNEIRENVKRRNVLCFRWRCGDVFDLTFRLFYYVFMSSLQIFSNVF
jgi:hypothetical protein